MTKIEAPACLNEKAKERWGQLIQLVAPHQHDLLAVYCSSYAEWTNAQEQLDRTGPLVIRDNHVVHSPWKTIRDNAAATIQRLARDLGIIDDDPILPPEIKINEEAADGSDNRAPKCRRFTDEEVIAVLRKTGGIVSDAARALGMGRQYFYDTYYQHPAVKAVLPSLRDEITDIAEGQHIRLVKAGDKDMVRYHLRCFGRERGYVEVTRQEQTGPAGGPVPVAVTVVSEDRFRELARELADEF